MDLKDFVAESLKQIIDGIKQAQEHAVKEGASINPVERPGNPAPITEPQTIEFDVAVTAVEGGHIKSGLGIIVGPVMLGTQAQVEGKDGSVNRIRFSVPLVIPRQRR